MDSPRRDFRYREKRRPRLAFLAFLVVLAFSGEFALARETPYFARNPSGHGSRLVFEFNSHIWLQERGKVARRLTNRATEEAFPAFSPDGRFVAFTGVEGQASEVFLTSLATGDTVRLTYDGGSDAKIQGWLGPTRLLYSTTIKSKKRGALLIVIDTKTHVAKPLPLVEASEGCVLDGNFVFVKNEKLIDNNRLYRGGYAQSILKIDADILAEQEANTKERKESKLIA